MKRVLLLLLLPLGTGCRTPIPSEWPWEKGPPVLTSSDIESLPKRFTVSYMLKRFGPGLPDPNTNLGMTYGRQLGGDYFFTWVPTHELPGPTELDNTDFVRYQVLAVFELPSGWPEDPQNWSYVYPKHLKGTKSTGWQALPTWEEMNK